MGKQKLFRVQALNEKGMMLDVEVMGHKAHGIAREALARARADVASGSAPFVHVDL